MGTISSKGIQLPNVNPRTVVFFMSPAVSGDFICVASSASPVLSVCEGLGLDSFFFSLR